MSSDACPRCKTLHRNLAQGTRCAAATYNALAASLRGSSVGGSVTSPSSDAMPAAPPVRAPRAIRPARATMPTTPIEELSLGAPLTQPQATRREILTAIGDIVRETSRSALRLSEQTASEIFGPSLDGVSDALTQYLEEENKRGLPPDSRRTRLLNNLSSLASFPRRPENYPKIAGCCSLVFTAAKNYLLDQESREQENEGAV